MSAYHCFTIPITSVSACATLRMISFSFSLTLSPLFLFFYCHLINFLL
nr:MAG TPA: hypothetical protein [Caudoviricetes sp.]